LSSTPSCLVLAAALALPLPPAPPKPLPHLPLSRRTILLYKVPPPLARAGLVAQFSVHLPPLRPPARRCRLRSKHGYPVRRCRHPAIKVSLFSLSFVIVRERAPELHSAGSVCHLHRRRPWCATKRLLRFGTRCAFAMDSQDYGGGLVPKEPLPSKGLSEA